MWGVESHQHWVGKLNSELWSSVCITNQSEKKYVFAWFFPSFFPKLCTRSMWGVESYQHWVRKHNSELWSIKNQSERKIFFPLIFPAFSGHFFKNFALGLCGLSKVINIWSGNSILDSIMHFPPFLIPFSPLSFWLYYQRFLSDFLHADLNCDLVFF